MATELKQRQSIALKPEAWQWFYAVLVEIKIESKTA